MQLFREHPLLEFLTLTVGSVSDSSLLVLTSSPKFHARHAFVCQIKTCRAYTQILKQGVYTKSDEHSATTEPPAFYAVYNGSYPHCR